MNIEGNNNGVLSMASRRANTAGCWRIRLVKRIVRERKQQQLTQQQLADKAGIGQSMLSQIENGERLPGAESLGALVHALGFRLDMVER